MKKELKERLEKSMIAQLDKLDDIDPTTGAVACKNVAEGAAMFAKVLEEAENSDRENDIRYRELKRDTIFRAIESACSIGTIGLGVAAYISKEKWIKAGFQLEQTGTFTVQTFKTIFMSIFKK